MTQRTSILRATFHAAALVTLVCSTWTCTETDPAVAPDEVIAAPSRPTGPRVTERWVSETYVADGAASNLEHEIAYQFDWGDGTLSQWGPPERSHSWDTDASYGVRVRARCVEHPVKRSEWSAPGLQISVQIPHEVVSPPTKPDGPVDVSSGEIVAYTTSGGGSNLGHPLQYRFNWGDGVDSGWLDYPVAAYTWPVGGDVDVSAFARCALDTAVISLASDSLRVTVTLSPESISRPDKPSGPLLVRQFESHDYTTGGATSSRGHVIEYQFSWGDGTFSGWQTSPTARHSWNLAGSRNVTSQARCRVHRAVKSDRSDVLVVQVVRP